jgi:regulator of protease activity HflC (stomatin/prohibitin superfamily)
MNALIPLYILLGLFGFIFVIGLLRSIRVVPTKTSLVVERLGKYSKTLEAGFHALFPFIDKVRYRHNLKEQAVDVPAQDCFTQDNVRVRVDGVLYLQVVDPKKASYGIKDYRYAAIQLAQTTMRSVIGKMELDKTFEERQNINASVVRSVDEASDAWGVNVSRYEIQNITVPDTILQAMEVQMKSEREKRALISRSVGIMEARVNASQASLEEAVNKSEGEKQKLINEAEGRAQEILAVARATASGIRQIAAAIQEAGGEDAVALRVAEGYLDELGRLAKKSTKLVLPLDLTSVDSMMRTVREMLSM